MSREALTDANNRLWQVTGILVVLVNRSNDLQARWTNPRRVRREHDRLIRGIVEAMESSNLLGTIAADTRATQINTVIIKDDLETINSNIILADTNIDLRFEGLESRVTAAAGRLDDSMQAVGDRIGPMVSDGLEGVRTAIAVLMYTLCHQIDRGLVLQEAKTAALEQKIADGFGRLWSLGDSSAQETAAMFGLGLGMV
jgi:hypothetical protein